MILYFHLSLDHADNTNIVKIITNLKNEVIYLSRSKLPLEFKKRVKSYKNTYQ